MASEWATEARLPMKRFARQEIADEALPLAFSCGFILYQSLIVNCVIITSSILEG
jgi:hypothetical protein